MSGFMVGFFTTSPCEPAMCVTSKDCFGETLATTVSVFAPACAFFKLIVLIGWWECSGLQSEGITDGLFGAGVRLGMGPSERLDIDVLGWG